MAANSKADTSGAPRTVDDYMALPYRIDVYWDEDYWAAELPDLPGCVAGADTWEELGAKIEDAKRTWFEATLELGREIPLPRATNYSGELRVRLGRKLHAEAARVADRSGISLNTLIVTAVAKEVGRKET